MLKIMPTAILLSAMATGVAFAADTKVLDHHVANMKTGNLEAVLSDYAPDAVIVTPAGMISPSGVFIDKDNRKLFTALTAKGNMAGNKSMETRYESLSPDTTMMHWVQLKGTPKELSGTDVFVIRGGKVVFQTVTVDAKK
jgi:ketosteroid isomerase-like protein